MKAPPNSGSDFFNYKGTFSIVLLTLVDHNYCFRYIDIGASGRSSDGGIFRNSSLKTALENNVLNLPEDEFFVAVDVFPLTPQLMKPYSRRQLTKEQRIFNYWLSRARRIVENAFGIMTSRFQIYIKPISLSSEKVEAIVKSTCALHNGYEQHLIHTYHQVQLTKRMSITYILKMVFGGMKCNHLA